MTTYKLSDWQGRGLLIAFGRWGGFYAVANSLFARFCIGWVSITWWFFDGDLLSEIALRGIDKALREDKNFRVSKGGSV